MKNFLVACQFLTRIHLRPNLVVSSQDMGTSTRAYPLVGLVLGLILSAIYFIFSWLGFPLFTIGILLVVVEIVLTGGLHLDGLMDCADGFFSYRPKDEILKIMKDSTVGANAVLALVSLLLLKVSFYLVVLPEQSWILLWMPILSRWTILFLATAYPYAGRKGSLGGTVIEQAGVKELRIGSCTTLLLAMGIAFFRSNFLALGTLWLFSWILGNNLAKKAQTQIGGLTGDVLGAILEIVEVAVLSLVALFLLMVLRFGG